MPEGAVYTLRRDRLGDGADTTVYLVRFPRAGLRARVQLFRQPRRLDVWCSKHGVGEAIVGGFYRREPFRPLGDLRMGGRAVRSERFPARYRGVRPALHAGDEGLRIARRDALPDTADGDLLQAGPLLVEHGQIVFDPTADVEGFSAAADQFDSDITAGRHPRAAIGVGDGHVTVLACDGRRSLVDDGLTMARAGGRHARRRLRDGDEPGRWRLHDAGSPRPPPQPALHRAGPAGARFTPDRQRAAVPRGLSRLPRIVQPSLTPSRRQRLVELRDAGHRPPIREINQ